MPVIVYGPIPCLPSAVHWVRLANEPRVTFAAAVDSKTGDNAKAGEEKPKRTATLDTKHNDIATIDAVIFFVTRLLTNVPPRPHNITS